MNTLLLPSKEGVTEYSFGTRVHRSFHSCVRSFHTPGVKTVHSSSDSDVTESLNVTELLGDCKVSLQCY